MTCLFTQYILPAVLLLCLYSLCLLTGLFTFQWQSIIFSDYFTVLYKPSIGFHSIFFWMAEVQLKHINIAGLAFWLWISILMFRFIDFICCHMFFALVVNTHPLHGAGTKIFLLERKTQILWGFVQKIQLFQKVTSAIHLPIQSDLCIKSRPLNILKLRLQFYIKGWAIWPKKKNPRFFFTKKSDLWCKSIFFCPYLKSFCRWQRNCSKQVWTLFCFDIPFCDIIWIRVQAKKKRPGCHCK